MKRIIVLAALLASACGGEPEAPENVADTAGNAAPAAEAFKTEEQRAIPVPGKIPGIDASVPPDVARHVARQEICGHWRSEADAGKTDPQIAQNVRTNCDGMDAELQRLRLQHADEGPAMNAMREFAPIGR